MEIKYTKHKRLGMYIISNSGVAHRISSTLWRHMERANWILRRKCIVQRILADWATVRVCHMKPPTAQHRTRDRRTRCVVDRRRFRFSLLNDGVSSHRSQHRRAAVAVALELNEFVTHRTKRARHEHYYIRICIRVVCSVLCRCRNVVLRIYDILW